MNRDKAQQNNLQLQKDAMGAEGETLGELEKLTAQIGGQHNKASAEYNALKEGMDSTFQFYQNTAQAKIDGVTSELNRVVSSTPDLTSGFKSDTADTSNSLSSTLQHLENSTMRVTHLIDDMQSRLDEVQKLREDKAMEMHGKISDLKKDAADQMSIAVSSLLSLQREAKVLQRQMMRQLNHFKQKVQSMEGTTSNQDSALIDEMTTKLNQLQMTHEKTMDWKRKNKHITAAWRNEVNAQLTNLHVSIGADADSIKNAQIGEEMDLNQDMREMQTRTRTRSRTRRSARRWILTRICG